jgi:hypothetical protein
MVLIFFVTQHYLLLIFICFVEKCTETKKLFTHPWPAMYVYFYTTQQNICLCVNTSHLS